MMSNIKLASLYWFCCLANLYSLLPVVDLWEWWHLRNKHALKTCGGWTESMVRGRYIKFGCYVILMRCIAMCWREKDRIGGRRSVCQSISCFPSSLENLVKGLLGCIAPYLVTSSTQLGVWGEEEEKSGNMRRGRGDFYHIGNLGCAWSTASPNLSRLLCSQSIPTYVKDIPQKMARHRNKALKEVYAPFSFGCWKTYSYLYLLNQWNFWLRISCHFIWYSQDCNGIPWFRSYTCWIPVSTSTSNFMHWYNLHMYSL